jgi:putative oxidoreductase
MSTATSGRRAAAPVGSTSLARPVTRVIGLLERIPNTFIALVARLSIASVFWTSGQTKVQGFVVNIISGEVQFGWPSLSDSVVALFQDEYKLPFIAPAIAAPMAAMAEHLFPLLLLIGLGTRFSALALLGMTMVIQIFVYPDAYPTHGTWAALLLYLIARGPGALSVDHWLAHRHAVAR